MPPAFQTANALTDEQRARLAELLARPVAAADLEREKAERWGRTAVKLGRQYAPPIKTLADGTVVYGAVKLNDLEFHGTPEHRGWQRATRDRLVRFCRSMPAEINAGRNVILAGRVGTGKDHMLTACMKLACDLGFFVRWENGVALWRKLRDSWDTRTPEDQVMRPYVAREVTVLAISDPLPHESEKSGGRLGKAEVDMFFEIVDQRCRARLATWVTCNVQTEQEARDRMTPQVWDRLKDGAIVQWCKWESKRKSVE